VERVASSPDGKTKAKVSKAKNGHGGGVLLWDVTQQTEQQAELLTVSEGAVSSVAFSHEIP